MTNRAMVARHLPSEPIWLNQVHGTQVLHVQSASLLNTQPVSADASMTQNPDQVLAVLCADCLPVVLANEAGSVVAVAHAGWRGLLGPVESKIGVLETTVQAMRALAPSEPIEARLGPAIGPTRFEVGNEVFEQFCQTDPAMAAGFFQVEGSPNSRPKWLANLYLLARLRLERMGVSVLDGAQWCTFEESDRFFSYRRDGATGRQATLVWIARR
jgi:polyphenol oxidase